MSYQDPFTSEAAMLNAHIDTVWQMGLTSLFSNNNQIVIPLSMTHALGDRGISELKLRLRSVQLTFGELALIIFSQLFGNAPVCATQDVLGNVLRIYLTSDVPVSPAATVPYASPPASIRSPDSHTSIGVPTPETSVRSPGKKSKVPRPPNSFILYRQEHHPKIKDQNPDLHNNDISVILGKQWSMEPQSVKDRYKARANAIKKKHAAENPGYRYAPRKASEKKRRMTARKLALLQTEVEQDCQPKFQSSMLFGTDEEPFMPTSVSAVPENMTPEFEASTEQPFPLLPELSNERPTMLG
jgi:hypothetical protein